MLLTKCGCGGELTLVHSQVAFVRVAFANGPHGVQAAGDDDTGSLREWCEWCRWRRGTLGKAHGGSGFGSSGLSQCEVGNQIHL